jgi:hypothetical protein
MTISLRRPRSGKKRGLQALTGDENASIAFLIKQSFYIDRKKHRHTANSPFPCQRTYLVLLFGSRFGIIEILYFSTGDLQIIFPKFAGGFRVEEGGNHSVCCGSILRSVIFLFKIRRIYEDKASGQPPPFRVSRRVSLQNCRTNIRIRYLQFCPLTLSGARR